MIATKDIVIDPELESLLPPLSDDEHAELLKSIVKDGFNDPIIVWLNHGVLVDGHNRHRIWRDVYASDEDKAPAIVEKPFDSRGDVKEFMLRRQLGVTACRLSELGDRSGIASRTSTNGWQAAPPRQTLRRLTENENTRPG